MIAGFYIIHLGADLLDDARGLMAEHRRQRVRIKPLHEMQVGMTEPGDAGADQNLARSGLLQADILDHQRLVDFMQDGGLHRCFLLFSIVVFDCYGPNLFQRKQSAPSPLVGEGWGEGSTRGVPPWLPLTRNSLSRISTSPTRGEVKDPKPPSAIRQPRPCRRRGRRANGR